MASRTLFDRGGLALRIHNQAPHEAVELLKQTTWGTDGGARYLHLDTGERIQYLSDPQFLTLHKGDGLLGIIGFSRREVQQPSGTASGYYIRYLSMLSAFQRNPALGGHSRRRSDGLVKSMVGRLIGRPRDFHVEPGQGSEQALFYAYVELENERSVELTQAMGFEPVGKFSTVLFSRFRPRVQAGVEMLRQEDLERVRERTREFYRDHALFSDCNLFSRGQYFVVRKAGKIMAGLQAFPSLWQVVDMPGFTGKLTLKLLPRLPWLRRLFNPNDFRFLAFEGLWHLPGSESELIPLMEGALAELGYHMGMVWLDQKSPLYPVLRAGKLGLLHKMNEEVPVDVIARFVGVPAEVESEIRSRPLYISAFDAT